MIDKNDTLNFSAYHFEHVCGGSLITQQHVITARHCTEDCTKNENTPGK